MRLLSALNVVVVVSLLHSSSSIVVVMTGIAISQVSYLQYIIPLLSNLRK